METAHALVDEIFERSIGPDLERAHRDAEGTDSGGALCSFLFFLRPERHSIRFHVDGLTELVRVAREVRVFPILQVDGHVPDYAEHVYQSLRSKKIEVSFVFVPPTLHKGADRVLVLQR